MASGNHKHGADAPRAAMGVRLVNFWGEIYPVMAGLRPGAIIEAPLRDRNPHIDFFKREGIFFDTLTGEEFARRRAAAGARPSLDRKRGAVMIYISLDEKTLHKIMDCDAADKSEELGALLGYPSCCVRRYQEVKLGLAPEIDAGDRFKYIPHRPCSPACAPSLSLEKKLAAAARSAAGGISNFSGSPPRKRNSSPPRTCPTKERTP